MNSRILGLEALPEFGTSLPPLVRMYMKKNEIGNGMRTA
jgi:hypothetical protein